MTEPSGAIPVIGLLGGVASGKSAVAARLSDLGAVVFDADAAVGGLLSSKELLERIRDEVDAGAVTEGALDRGALARTVFADKAKRLALESILHPPVIAAARALIEHPPKGARAVVIDAPLLLEAGMKAMCDELWFVDTPPDRRERVAAEARGWGPGELRRREDVQVPLTEKRKHADRVIPNSAGLDSLTLAVDAAWDALMSGS